MNRYHVLEGRVFRKNNALENLIRRGKMPLNQLCIHEETLPLGKFHSYLSTRRPLLSNDNGPKAFSYTH